MWKILVLRYEIGSQKGPDNIHLLEFNSEAAARTAMEWLEAHHYGQFVLLQDPALLVADENGQPRRL
jgi:hypothetical protein